MKDPRRHGRSLLRHLVPLVIATVTAWPRAEAATAVPASTVPVAVTRTTARTLATAAQPGAHAAAARPDTLTATVNKLDLEAGTVDLLTGVGHALRIRRIQLPTGTKVLSGTRATPMSALTPGCVVRVEYSKVAGRTVASAVTLLRTGARERQP